MKYKRDIFIQITRANRLGKLYAIFQGREYDDRREFLLHLTDKHATRLLM